MMIKHLIALFLALMAPYAMAAETQPLINAHEAVFKDIDGNPLPLSHYRGKLLLVVNTASQCGLTGQYAGLETLWQRYKARGLVVLAVPSNQFGSQEPGTEEEIKNFTQSSYKTSFPIAAKTEVIGKTAHPFYQWAAGHAGIMGAPKWNFHKYLISPEGNFIDWFSSTTEPEDKKLIEAIESNLPEKTSDKAVKP